MQLSNPNDLEGSPDAITVKDQVKAATCRILSSSSRKEASWQRQIAGGDAEQADQIENHHQMREQE